MSIISEEVFSYLKSFLSEKSGYHLTENKKYLLEARLKPVLEAHKMNDFTQIVNSIRMDTKGSLAVDVIEAMTINETLFFRDDSPFKIFKETVLPSLRERPEEKAIKIWSAACSTGQEPYSIAMILDQEVKKINHEIYASDINKEVVNKGREGIYSNLEVNRGLPTNYRDKYFTQLNENKWKIQDKLRQKINYFEQNLCDNIDSFKGPYDVVFLRNVLIYFDQDLKDKILQKISRTMQSNGFLFLGTSENIYNKDLGFIREPSLTGIYRKA